MYLSDEELSAVHSVIYDEVYYGDDEIAYATPGSSELADSLRSALEFLDAEGKSRKLW